MMLVRVVRAVVGAGLLLVGLPLLLAGGALWFAMQHQDPAGGYSASLTTITTDGYAVVASDVDALLRREAPFTRGGQTTLRLTAHTDTGPAFVGLAPPADVARYLAGVRYARVDEVRLARGPLPVVTAPVDGVAAPAGIPDGQPFWRASSRSGTLEWSPYELRGQQLALVVMDPQGRAPVTVDLTARVHPEWLGSTTLGLLVLGTVLLLVAIVALAWPSRPREIVYVVPPAQLPEIAAHLGIPVPRAAAGALDRPLPPAPCPVPAPVAIPAPMAPEPAWSLPPPAEPPPPAAPPPVSCPPAASSLPVAVPPVSCPPAPSLPPTPSVATAPEGCVPEVPQPPAPPGAPAAGHPPAGFRPVPSVLEWPPPDARRATASPAPVPAAALVPAPALGPDAVSTHDHHNCRETGVSGAR